MPKVIERFLEMKNLAPGRFTQLGTILLIQMIFGLTAVFGQIRFQDDFEKTFDPDRSNQVYDVWYRSGWKAGGYMAQTTEIAAREGSQCVKAVMARNTDGKSRTEIGVNLDHSLGHYWYGFSIYIPEDINLHRVVTDNNNYHCVIAQWGVWENNPGLPDFALRFAPDEFRVTYEPGTDFQYLWDGPIIQGQWVDWVFHIYWTKANDGILEVWQNGELVFGKYDFTTTDGDGDDVKSKIGMYYSGWGEHNSDYEKIYCYFDTYTIANGLLELGTVAPWAADASDGRPCCLGASVVSSSEIMLKWRDNSEDEIGFVIEKKIDNSFEQIAVVDSNITSFIDSGLDQATTYTYRVAALMHNGTSAYTNEALASTYHIGGIYQEQDKHVSFEAEHGELGNRWTVGESDSASGSRYIAVNASTTISGDKPDCIDPDCIASYYFYVMHPGDYRFWYRMLPDGDDKNSFFWRLDNGAWLKEENHSAFDDWFFKDTDQTDLLPEGYHILEIGYTEHSVSLDKFVLQSDNHVPPAGQGPAESEGSGIAPPASPGYLSAEAVSDKQINISWIDHSDDEEGFRIERKSGSSTYYTLANVDSNQTAFSDQFFLSSGTDYTYRIRAYDGELFSNYSNEATDTTLYKDDVSIDEARSGLPRELALDLNYPNPFNPSTTISYQLPEAGNVQLRILNINGQQVETLVNEFQNAGYYQKMWQPKGLPSGVYTYELIAGDERRIQKLLYQK